MIKHGLAVQWLRLRSPNAGRGQVQFLPGQETRPHMPPLRVSMPQLKILHATVKTEDTEPHN